MSRRSEEGLRNTVAQEAARLMADEGVRDFGSAKRKAAERLGVSPRCRLPTNGEIQAALVAHQRLFLGELHDDTILRKRETAMEAMRLLDDFGAKLVGPVLAGTSAEHGEVNLHVFADAPDDIVHALMSFGIPFEDGRRRYRMSDGTQGERPVYRFIAGEERVELTVFDRREVSSPPLSPVDGKPMRRAGMAEVESLLDRVAGP
jgi:hypothetical protein